MTAPSNLIATALDSDRIKLQWTPGNDYQFTLIERSADGGSNYAQIDSIRGYQTSYTDDTPQDGKEYYYQIRGYAVEPEGWTSYSNADSAITPNTTPGLLTGTCISPTQIKLDWYDQSANETGFKIYKDGAYLDVVGVGVQTYTAGTLTSGQYYKFKVLAYNSVAPDSGFSNEVEVFTYDPPNAPSNLEAVAASTTQLNLSWQDNSENEQDFHIEESSTGPSSGFSEVAIVGAGESAYPRTGLSGGTQYWYRVRAHNTSNYSAYCAVASGITQGAVAKPGNVQLFSAKGTDVEIIFQDNSSDEDYHSIERKTGAGSYAEIKQLEPNRTYFKDTGRSPGDVCYYRIRGKQGVVWSAYSDEVSITTLTTPATPTGLAVSEQADTWQRLAWNASAGAQGYVIERSLNGSSWSAYLTIQRGDVLTLKAQGLSAGTIYYWRISAYNGNGTSAASSSANSTTAAEYSESAFERYARRANLNLVVLIEVNPLIELGGFTLTGGQTYTYQTTVQERGIEITEVLENGVALALRTSIALVEANAGSFFFDYWARLLYVRTKGGQTPANYQIDAGFWLYFTSHRSPTVRADYNDRNYLPLVQRSGIPDVTQEVKNLYEGSLAVSTGTVTLLNAKVGGVNYFDRLWTRYKWENRRCVIKAGGPAFTYSQFRTIVTGVVSDRVIDDKFFQLMLTDYREGTWRQVPVSEFWTADYPALDENAKGRKKPFGYGTITGAEAICVDSVSKKWAFHDGRVKTVASVQQNSGTALTENTNYFVDYRRGVIEFAEAFAVETSDIVTVAFSGHTEEYGDVLIDDCAEVFLDFLVRYLGLTVADIDTDSVYYVKKNAARTARAYVFEEKSSNDIIKTIEQTVLAYSRQDEAGRIGLKLAEATAPSGARVVWNHQFKAMPTVRVNRDNYFQSVKVYYAENPHAQSWERVVREKASILYSARISKDVSIYTYASNLTDATAVADAMRDAVCRDLIDFGTSAHVFACLAGDLIKVTRDRYYNGNGSLSEATFRILKIVKRLSANSADLTVEQVG